MPDIVKLPKTLDLAAEFPPVATADWEKTIVDDLKGADYAKKLPSHPDNAAKQLPVDLNWYIQFEAKAAAAYQNMLTE